jgi:mannose-6-phosphate isomerase-like protein (cupin superfamily)
MDRMTTRPQAQPVSIREAIDALPGPWQQRDLATANDCVIRIARFEGEFPWHTHEDDELFLCWDGSFRLEWEEPEPAGQPPAGHERRLAVTLTAGELFVVPAGVRHRPVADQVAHGLMVERPRTAQYGR